MTEVCGATEGWREELRELVSGYVPEDVPDEEVYVWVLEQERPDAVEWLCEYSGVEPDWRVMSWVFRNSDASLFWFLWNRGTPWTNRAVCLSEPIFEEYSPRELLVGMSVGSVEDAWGGLDRSSWKCHS
jgi:hypothetical protein